MLSSTLQTPRSLRENKSKDRVTRIKYPQGTDDYLLSDDAPMGSPSGSYEELTPVSVTTSYIAKFTNSGTHEGVPEVGTGVGFVTLDNSVYRGSVVLRDPGSGFVSRNLLYGVTGDRPLVFPRLKRTDTPTSPFFVATPKLRSLCTDRITRSETGRRETR